VLNHMLSISPLGSGEALPCNITLPSTPSPPILPPHPASQPDTPVVSRSATPKTQPLRLPKQKPPEIETLVQCRACDIPILVFVSQESRLLPRPLLAEYACVCLGFFFISDINVGFPLVILLVIFIDLPAGGEGQRHHKHWDTRLWACAMAVCLGVGSRRRRWITGKC
jgi:hypothetical protein